MSAPMSLIDASRIERLQAVFGEDLPTIITEIAESMRTCASALETAIAAEDLDETARTAHCARNDALMVGAVQLLEPLQKLERAAREGQLPQAQSSAVEVTQALPDTLQELEQLRP